LVLLSQIQHSQTEINSTVRNKNNEKISLISNIYQMLTNDFKWNNNFDVVEALGNSGTAQALFTPNNRSLFSLCSSFYYGLSFIEILEELFNNEEEI